MKNTTGEPITAAHLRSKIAERNIPKYVVAALSRVHPVKLSALLNERCPVDQRLAARILLALEEQT